MEKTNKEGMLYLCPTPIGNLADITLRTLEVLKSVDLIACEDTRDSARLLKHYDIHTPLTSYHDHNRISKGEYLIDLLTNGKSIALISDAGMPGISDPGEDIVRSCIESGIAYTVLPGASASVTALVMSGLPTGRYVFEGFLPRVGKERKERLRDIAEERRTIILYEAPHHLLKTLEDLGEYLGNRQISICREITKIYEEKLLFYIDEAIDYFSQKPPKGEFVLIIKGLSDEEVDNNRKKQFEGLSTEEHLALYTSRGMDKKEAMKAVAKDLGVSKREIYNKLNRGGEENE